MKKRYVSIFSLLMAFAMMLSTVVSAAYVDENPTEEVSEKFPLVASAGALCDETGNYQESGAWGTYGISGYGNYKVYVSVYCTTTTTLDITSTVSGYQLLNHQFDPGHSTWTGTYNVGWPWFGGPHRWEFSSSPAGNTTYAIMVYKQ